MLKYFFFNFDDFFFFFVAVVVVVMRLWHSTLPGFFHVYLIKANEKKTKFKKKTKIKSSKRWIQLGVRLNHHACIECDKFDGEKCPPEITMFGHRDLFFLFFLIKVWIIRLSLFCCFFFLVAKDKLICIDRCATKTNCKESRLFFEFDFFFLRFSFVGFVWAICKCALQRKFWSCLVSLIFFLWILFSLD